MIAPNSKTPITPRLRLIYDQLQESESLLKVLARSSASIQAGRVKPVEKAFADVRKCIARRGVTRETSN